ncbi:hypothetical protein HN011_004349 [Eciton burchellii]|nr:hypothetical protein HN011_004349 [Eciton burchellii]
MPPKKKGRKNEKEIDETKTQPWNTLECYFATPGPKYKLKSLVGYTNHCISKYRNPAYTFGSRRIFADIERSPGPKYMIKDDKLNGYTFGIAKKFIEPERSPGPKYKLPSTLRGPYFSLKCRTILRKVTESPGPQYFLKSIRDSPAFSMGIRPPIGKPVDTGGHYAPYNPEVIKPKAPRYTITGRRIPKMISLSPGPIYAVPPPKPTRAFSFGVKHSECAPPYITKCDEQC